MMGMVTKVQIGLHLLPHSVSCNLAYMRSDKAVTLRV